MIGVEINHLIEYFKLGTEVKEIVQVTGVLLHKMYCVSMEKGEYAVKVFNPEIMKCSVA